MHGYLARFKLIPKSVASLMWKSIRSALGAYANTKTSILTSCYLPLDLNPQLCHPIIFNWALLTSCPPMRSDYQSPLSIGAIQKDALFAAQSLSAKVVFGQATQVAYSNMSQVIPIEIKDLYVGEGRAECVVYNLAHAIRPQLKRNLIKFLIRGCLQETSWLTSQTKTQVANSATMKKSHNLIFWRNVSWLRASFKQWEGNVFC